MTCAGVGLTRLLIPRVWHWELRSVPAVLVCDGVGAAGAAYDAQLGQVAIGLRRGTDRSHLATPLSILTIKITDRSIRVLRDQFWRDGFS